MEPRPFRIAGRKVESTDVLSVQSPFDGASVSQVHLAGPSHIEEAISAARGAWERREGEEEEVRVRVSRLIAVFRGLHARGEELIDSIVREGGKPRRFARAEVMRAAETVEFTTHEAAKFVGEVVPVGASSGGRGRVAFTSRVPVGPVAAITPFNFPLNLVLHKVAPALAVGCPVLLKPDPRTPSASLILAEILESAGVPGWALSVLPCRVEHASPLVEDERIGLLTFTGSQGVGWALKARAGRKKVVLELGGNAAALVCADADLHRAAETLALSAFAYAGQSCISVQRILVEKSVYNEFRDRLVDCVRTQIKLGAPEEEETITGPVIDDSAASRIEGWKGEALRHGARLLIGGPRQGRMLPPFLMEGVAEDQPLWKEELFGPGACLTPFSTFDEAISLTNRSRYGLQVAVWTGDLQRLLAAHARIRAGAIIHNDSSSFRVDLMPYGGVGESGLGREGVRYAMEDMTEPRLLVMRREAP